MRNFPLYLQKGYTPYYNSKNQKFKYKKKNVGRLGNTFESPTVETIRGINRTEIPDKK